MDTFKKYLTIQKVDDEERMVYGWASTPDLDSDGEIIKLDALEKALPGYMKFPTLREMHQPRAAGTTKTAEIVDKKNEKGLWIGAKVVSDEAWKLVKEGVYKGFSIGGNVIKRMKNIITELDLVEISLVDVPANKAATIELWKAQDMNKNASTAMSMANLMIQVKYAIEYYDYLGKDTKKLKKVLEMVKSLVAEEATEPEDDTSSKGAVLDSSEHFKKQVQLLSQIEISDNPALNAVVKGVMIAMSQKADELENKEVTTQGEVTQTGTDEGTPVEQTAEVEDTATATEEGDTATEKEAGEAAGDLQKISDATKKLEKLTPTTPKADPEKETLTKAVSTLAAGFSKMTDMLVSIDERLKKVEATPAEVKSKTVAVYKSDEEKPKDDATGNGTGTTELAKKQARLKELEDYLDREGRAAFVKSGYNNEAAKLQAEIDALKQKVR